MRAKEATLRHIEAVRVGIDKVIVELLVRGEEHDASKLKSPEVEIFDQYTPLLATTPFGTPEYHRILKEMGVALSHHYSVNRHHPEHFDNGINGMNLVDLMELMCDWVAAAARHHDGDVLKSIELNQKRFGYTDELKTILLNTANFLTKEKGNGKI